MVPLAPAEGHTLVSYRLRIAVVAGLVGLCFSLSAGSLFAREKDKADPPVAKVLSLFDRNPTDLGADVSASDWKAGVDLWYFVSAISGWGNNSKIKKYRQLLTSIERKLSPAIVIAATAPGPKGSAAYLVAPTLSNDQVRSFLDLQESTRLTQRLVYAKPFAELSEIGVPARIRLRAAGKDSWVPCEVPLRLLEHGAAGRAERIGASSQVGVGGELSFEGPSWQKLNAFLKSNASGKPRPLQVITGAQFEQERTQLVPPCSLDTASLRGRRDVLATMAWKAKHHTIRIRDGPAQETRRVVDVGGYRWAAGVA